MSRTRQLVAPVLLWLLVAVVVGVLFETPAWSATLFEAAVDQTLVNIGTITSTIMLLSLVAGYGIAFLWSWRTEHHAACIRLLYGGVVIVVIYLLNRILKTLFGQIRPCHTIQSPTDCPPLDNFSYPSNHTVIAFGLAMGLAFAIPWLSFLVFPVAVVEGISRVLAGHHYPHDVLAAAVLGTAGALATLLIFEVPQGKHAEQLSAIRARYKTLA